MIDLSGKTALVTGGSRGIGRAIALRLAEQGADVAFSYRGNEAAANETKAGIEALGMTDVKTPVVPVVANVLAKPISDPQEIVRRLVEQVTGTVRWRECAAFMAGQGVTTFYEVGSGKVLTGLLKRIAEGATGAAVGTPADVAAFKAARDT